MSTRCRRCAVAGSGHRAIALLLVLLLCGCAAEVVRFSATPRHVCPGDAVELEWAVKGRASLEMVPRVADAPNGHVAKAGHATLHPAAPTKARLHVARLFGHATTSVQEIQMARPETLTVSLADSSAGCDAESVWASVQARRFASRLRVVGVTAPLGDGRAYHVEHAGADADLEAGAVTLVFDGLPVAGEWNLRSPLKPGETCGTPTLPPSLSIVAFTECAEDAQ